MSRRRPIRGLRRKRAADRRRQAWIGNVCRVLQRSYGPLVSDWVNGRGPLVKDRQRGYGYWITGWDSPSGALLIPHSTWVSYPRKQRCRRI